MRIKSGCMMGWMAAGLMSVASLETQATTNTFSATLVVKRGGTTTQQRVWLQGKRYRTELDQKGNYEVYDDARFYRYSAPKQSAQLIMDHPAHPGAPWITWATYATTLIGTRHHQWHDWPVLIVNGGRNSPPSGRPISPLLN